MRHINKKFLFTLISVVIVFTSCQKNFLNVNKDPNRVTDDNITPELIFTQAEVAVGDRAVGGTAADAGVKLPLQFAQNWIGYMAANGDFARDEQETSYGIDFTFGNTLWQDYYNTLFDLHLAKSKALVNGGDTVLAGAAMVLSAKLFQELVDLYGNIPYSQAFQSAKYSHPAYDKAQDVYTSLQAGLDTAIGYLKQTAAGSFKAADVINHGDRNKWILFANTLKLRLLIRQSQVPGFDPSAEIAKIISNGGVLWAGQSISVNPGYSNQVNKQSPFYANYGYTATGTLSATSDNANLYIINILSSSNDPRISRFFAPVGGNFVGDQYGDLTGNIPAGNQSSYFGPALIGSASQDQWIFPSFESMFLYAEAVARGWIPNNHNAQAAYEAAVKESFTWLGVPSADSAATAYMNNNNIANWANAGSTPASQAKFIVFQKYIADVGIAPLESYADQLRLNFLPPGYISLNTARVSNTLPVRLLYPQSEYTTNAVSVLAEGKINAFTSKLFWQQ